MSERISKYIDKLLWGALLLIAGYVANQIQSASKSIAELNEKVAVVIVQLSNSSETIKDHEARLRLIEKRR